MERLDIACEHIEVVTECMTSSKCQEHLLCKLHSLHNSQCLSKCFECGSKHVWAVPEVSLKTDTCRFSCKPLGHVL